MTVGIRRFTIDDLRLGDCFSKTRNDMRLDRVHKRLLDAVEDYSAEDHHDQHEAKAI